MDILTIAWWRYWIRKLFIQILLSRISYLYFSVPPPLNSTETLVSRIVLDYFCGSVIALLFCFPAYHFRLRCCISYPCCIDLLFLLVEVLLWGPSIGIRISSLFATDKSLNFALFQLNFSSSLHANGFPGNICTRGLVFGWMYQWKPWHRELQL